MHIPATFEVLPKVLQKDHGGCVNPSHSPPLRKKIREVNPERVTEANSPIAEIEVCIFALSSLRPEFTLKKFS